MVLRSDMSCPRCKSYNLEYDTGNAYCNDCGFYPIDYPAKYLVVVPDDIKEYHIPDFDPPGESLPFYIDGEVPILAKDMGFCDLVSHYDYKLDEFETVTKADGTKIKPVYSRHS